MAYNNNTMKRLTKEKEEALDKLNFDQVEMLFNKRTIEDLDKVFNKEANVEEVSRTWKMHEELRTYFLKKGLPFAIASGNGRFIGAIQKLERVFNELFLKEDLAGYSELMLHYHYLLLIQSSILSELKNMLFHYYTNMTLIFKVPIQHNSDKSKKVYESFISLKNPCLNMYDKNIEIHFKILVELNETMQELYSKLEAFPTIFKEDNILFNEKLKTTMKGNEEEIKKIKEDGFYYVKQDLKEIFKDEQECLVFYDFNIKYDLENGCLCLPEDFSFNIHNIKKVVLEN